MRNSSRTPPSLQLFEGGALGRFAETQAGKLREARVAGAHPSLGVEQHHAFFQPFDDPLQGLLRGGVLSRVLRRRESFERNHRGAGGRGPGVAQTHAMAAGQLDFQLIHIGIPGATERARVRPQPRGDGGAIRGAKELREVLRCGAFDGERHIVCGSQGVRFAQKVRGGGAQVRDTAGVIQYEKQFVAGGQLGPLPLYRQFLATFAFLARDGQAGEHGAIFETLK